MREGTLDQGDMTESKLSLQILAMFLGCVTVYGALFGFGYFLYGNMMAALISFAIMGLSGWMVFKNWDRLG
jgi:zinc transporter ZupT